MDLERLERKLDRIRLISVIAVVASGFGSLLMFIIGAVKVFRAYMVYFEEGLFSQVTSDPATNVAIALVIQAIDLFLIAVVLLIFGAGIYSLFVHELDPARPEVKSWTRIRSISQLKSILAELVIIILMVKFLESALRTFGSYTWEILVLPAGVLMFAAAVRLLNLKGSP